MPKELTERRLRELSAELRRVQSDLAIADEQVAHFVEEADDARLRALVSETPGAQREHRDAHRHAAAMTRHRDELRESIVRLEADQDQLLDRLRERS